MARVWCPRVEVALRSGEASLPPSARRSATAPGPRCERERRRPRLAGRGPRPVGRHPRALGPLLQRRRLAPRQPVVLEDADRLLRGHRGGPPVGVAQGHGGAGQGHLAYEASPLVAGGQHLLAPGQVGGGLVRLGGGESGQARAEPDLAGHLGGRGGDLEPLAQHLGRPVAPRPAPAARRRASGRWRPRRAGRRRPGRGPVPPATGRPPPPTPRAGSGPAAAPRPPRAGGPPPVGPRRARRSWPGPAPAGRPGRRAGGPAGRRGAGRGRAGTTTVPGSGRAGRPCRSGRRRWSGASRPGGRRGPATVDHAVLQVCECGGRAAEVEGEPAPSPLGGDGQLRPAGGLGDRGAPLDRRRPSWRCRGHASPPRAGPGGG